jgi:hypothetical protein
MKKVDEENKRDSLSYKIWFFGSPKHTVPLVYHLPELVHHCVKNFDLETGIITSWNLRVVISDISIRDMLCIHTKEGLDGFKRFSMDIMEIFWRSRNLAQQFFNQETKRPHNDRSLP